MEMNISVGRAWELIGESARAVGTEKISASLAWGRVLSEDVVSPMDQPPWSRSPLDGYAFAASDSKGASRERPVKLKVIEKIYAGLWPKSQVRSGECVRIMTGAPIPPGCDCVLRQEDTDLGQEVVAIYEELRPWSNYCFAGEDFEKGSVILPAGTRLNGNAMGVLYGAGLSREEVELSVYKKVRCALICTGDELASPKEQPLPAGKIYSSNEGTLTARLRELGMEVVLVRGQFPDDAQALCGAMREAAATSECIFTVGGVSVGEKDVLPEALDLLGAEVLFHGVSLKPGSPMMYSRYEDARILSLSGNPFAALATFELFGRHLLSKLSGYPDLFPVRASAILDTPFAKFSKISRFLRGNFAYGHVSLPDGHSSGQLASSVGTNCLVYLPAGNRPFEAGDTVWVYLL